MKYDHLIDLRSDLDEAEQTYLRKLGWRYSSETPHCHWRWFKDFDNVLHCCSQDDALNIERIIDVGEADANQD